MLLVGMHDAEASVALLDTPPRERKTYVHIKTRARLPNVIPHSHTAETTQHPSTMNG